MEGEAFFSVIIPVYNGEKFIPAVLNSVLNQTFKRYELVIVNDGSPDNSDEIIKEFICQYPTIQITYLQQNNKGLGGARNTAIQKARGALIALLDQDDLWYPSKLAEVYKVFNEHPEVSLVCHNEAIRKSGQIVGTSSYGPNNPDMFRRLLFKGNCLSPSAVSFRKKIIDEIGYFSEDVKRVHFTEDYDFWLRIAEKRNTLYFLPAVLGEFTIHDSNYSYNDMEKIIRNTVNVLDQRFTNYRDKQSFDWFRLRLSKANWYFRNAYYFFKTKQVRLFIKYLLLSIITNPLVFFTALTELKKKSNPGRKQS
ncbi:MAG: glycosyltransferase [Candidatus Vogelbacteria bacterium]|nr:glycosyltransferase [Candidatus Vogelbacteria bacterium]